MKFLLLIFGCLLSENLFFGKLSGSVYGNPIPDVKMSAKLGLWTMLVSTLSVLVLSMLECWVLAPLGARFLRLLVLAALVLVFTLILRRAFAGKCPEFENLYLQILIGGVTVGIAAQSSADIVVSTISAIFTGAGYLMMLALFAGVRDRLSGSKIPACLKGLPISLITAGLMTLAFMGFTGLAG